MERVEVLFDNSGATVVIDATNEKVSKAIIHLLAAISDTSGNIDAIVNQVLEFQKQKNKKAEVKAVVDSFNIFLRGGFTAGRQNGKGVAERFLRDFTINHTDESPKKQLDEMVKNGLAVVPITEIVSEVVGVLKKHNLWANRLEKTTEPIGSAVGVCNAALQIILAEYDERLS